jgi:hypothetical protein
VLQLLSAYIIRMTSNKNFLSKLHFAINECFVRIFRKGTLTFALH